MIAGHGKYWCTTLTSVNSIIIALSLVLRLSVIQNHYLQTAMSMLQTLLECSVNRLCIDIIFDAANVLIDNNGYKGEEPGSGLKSQ
jgi:hypothetical protein